MNGKRKIFFGIFLPEEAKEFACQVQQKLRREGSNFKWVKPDNLHITVNYIGYVKSEEIEEWQNRLYKFVKNLSPFEVSLKNVSFFPSIKNTRVIVLGVEQGKDVLDRIGSSASAEFGGKFGSAHVTICRVRGNPNLQSVYGSEILQTKENYKFNIEAISLIESVRQKDQKDQKDGVNYKLLYESRIPK
jgi:RNA 2',3'-cyclic 3'-phosphodiesterase